MQDFDLKFYLSLFWRRFPLFLFVWALISALGVLAALFLIQEEYKSTASILVESEQIEGSTVNLSANEQIQVIEQRIMTRQNLLEIADEHSVFGTRNEHLSPSERVDEMEDATAFQSMDFGRERRGSKNAIAFTVSFAARSGPLAAGVTNDLVTQILELNATQRKDLAESNREFFEQEVARLNRELTDLENDLSNFKTENQTSLPQLLEFNQEQLIALKENLTRLEEEERELNDQRNTMLRVIENPELIEIETAQLSPDERELARLESERATLRATFSANHPKVRAVDTQMKLLQSRLGQASGGGGDLVEQRISKMKLALEQLDRRFLILREQRDEVVEEIRSLESAVTKSPKVEAALNVMDRRYSSLKRQYAEAEERLAKAKTGEVIEDRGKGERFSVIERANVPDEAEGPGKLIIAAGGVAGGFFVALGLVVLLELLNRSIRRPADLINGLGLQPFATIPYIMTTRDVRRKRFSALAVLAMIAIAIPAVLFAIHQYYAPLDFLLGRVAEELGIDSLMNSIRG